MKIYITGIAGFLGSNLAKSLLKLGHSVSGNDNLILGDIENLPKKIKIDRTDCCDYQMVKILKAKDVNIAPQQLMRDCQFFHLIL